MLKITCPVCGLAADETEFTAGGEAHIVRPASTNPDRISDKAFRDYLYIRKNPRGLEHELWLCARGCGKWFHAQRDTYTQDFKRFYRLDEPKPKKPPARKTRAKSKAAKS
ncbi:Sarcosine oxidase delta subunit [hydrothermal vent metagenome]|uniref:Sarcosine oxidase delta subunit n=1 Tax=hydrothermal vent metagenome TaxID=652676 RepID=A0A3B0TXK0_9ZZZZ